MKKFAFILAACAMVFASCAEANKDDNKDAQETKVSAAKQGEPHETDINIRYVSQDSLLKYYIYADAVSQANQNLQLDLMKYGNQLQSQAQQLQEAFQQKLQNNGFINESAAQSEYNSLQQKIANYDNLFNKRQADVQDEMLKNTIALHDSINNFIIDYNKEHHYDAILYQESTLYLNPALDITDEVVKGLNDRYGKITNAADTTATKK